MRKVIPLAVQNKRAEDTSRFAGEKRRADLITERMKKHVAEMNRLGQQAAECDDTDDVIRLHRRIFDLIGEATKNAVPCKPGCSSCCYQPVLISHAEADLIARETGRTTAAVDYTLQADDAYVGKPCSFLNEKTGACRIYASRPMACRGHYSVAMDDVMCYIHPGHSMRVPYLNTQQFHKNFIRALTLQHAPHQADVRAWFPKEGK